MTKAETEFVKLVAKARGKTVEECLAEFATAAGPAVEKGRLVRVRLYSATAKPIKHLDFTGLDALREVRNVYQGDLESVTFGKHPKLEVIALPRNKLKTVDLSGCTALTTLDLMHNKLETLTGLAKSAKSVLLLGNPIAPPERAPKAKKAPAAKQPRSLTKMNTQQLHAFVDAYNWDDGPKKLAAVIAHPKCDLGTALYIYWLSEPLEQEEQPWVALMREIERKVVAKEFASKKIPFDVTNINGTDWSSDSPKIPKVMRQRIR